PRPAARGPPGEAPRCAPRQAGRTARGGTRRAAPLARAPVPRRGEPNAGLRPSRRGRGRRAPRPARGRTPWSAGRTRARGSRSRPVRAPSGARRHAPAGPSARSAAASPTARPRASPSRRRAPRRAAAGRAALSASRRAAARAPRAGRAGETRRSSLADNRSVGRDRYRVLELLGEGAGGVVYRAADGEQEVALKVLRAADPVAQRRFAREARLARESESRHLVRILDVGDDYFVMPLYEGGSLAAGLARSGSIDVSATIRLAAQLGQALDALHARAAVHRDA